MSEVTVDDLLARAGLPRNAANKKVSDVHIMDFSMRHCKNWRSLPAFLQMDKSSASDLQYAMGGESDKRKQFLEKWQQEKGGDATYRILMEALLKVQCRDEAEYISDVLLKGEQTSGQTSTNGASSGYANGGSRAPQVSLNSPPAPEAAVETSTPQDKKPTLLEVCKELKPLADKWREVGELLEVAEEELAKLETAGLKPEQCLMKVLKMWLNKTETLHTWKVVQEVKDYLKS